LIFQQNHSFRVISQSILLDIETFKQAVNLLVTFENSKFIPFFKQKQLIKWSMKFDINVCLKVYVETMQLYAIA